MLVRTPAVCIECIWTVYLCIYSCLTIDLCICTCNYMYTHIHTSNMYMNWIKSPLDQDSIESILYASGKSCFTGDLCTTLTQTTQAQTTQTQKDLSMRGFDTGCWCCCNGKGNSYYIGSGTVWHGMVRSGEAWYLSLLVCRLWYDARLDLARDGPSPWEQRSLRVCLGRSTHPCYTIRLHTIAYCTVL